MLPGSGIAPERGALNAWKRFVVLPFHFARRPHLCLVRRLLTASVNCEDKT
jgi:hypothetical protein